MEIKTFVARSFQYTVTLVTTIILTGLTDFLYQLDERYMQKTRKEGCVMAKKRRKVGGDSVCAPPINAPRWTMNIVQGNMSF